MWFSRIFVWIWVGKKEKSKKTELEAGFDILLISERHLDQGENKIKFFPVLTHLSDLTTRTIYVCRIKIENEIENKWTGCIVSRFKAKFKMKVDYVHAMKYASAADILRREKCQILAFAGNLLGDSFSFGKMMMPINRSRSVFVQTAMCGFYFYHWFRRVFASLSLSVNKFDCIFGHK